MTPPPSTHLIYLDQSHYVKEITLTRRLVKLRDVKLAALVGDVKNGPVGYLQLSGFSKGAAQELQQAYQYLDSVAEGGLRGVILDLRGNPGEGVSRLTWRF